MKNHITKNSVFDDLGFDENEAKNLKIRALLMREIESEIKKRNLTQAQAAKILDISQPRINNILNGKIHLFTVDTLINMIDKLGKPVTLTIGRKKAA